MKLSEICEKGSSNISLNKIEDNFGDYPLYGASGFVKGVDFYHQSEPYIGIVKDGSGVGKVDEYPAKSSLVGTMQYIFPKDGCELRFLKYLLMGMHLEKHKSGAAIPHIYFKDYSNTIVPLPKLAEQQQIISELDLLSEVIEKKKVQIEELDKLAQSIFYDIFGDPVSNEKGWDMVILKNVTIRFSDGPFGSNLKSSHYRDEGIRVIRLQNIGVNEFIDLDKAYITEDHYKELIKFTCYSGDIVIGTLGSPNLRACIIPNDIDKCINKADCVLCRVNNEIANAKYICYLLNCESLVKAACLLSHGETRTRISAGQLRDYNIPLPPLALQQEFAAKVEAIEQMKAKVRQSLKETEELFNSRMDYYFN